MRLSLTRKTVSTALMMFALLGAACAPAASQPTAAPAKPTEKPAEKAAPKAPEAAATQPPVFAPKPAEKAAPAAKDAPKVDASKMAEYFSGKTIELYIGYAPGGGYDIRGRIFAEFFQRHVPGNPKVAIQNMAGGGGLQATRHVMRARPDGLSMVTIPSGVFLLELLGEKQEGFDINQPLKLGNYEVPAAAYTPVWARTELATTWDQIVEAGKRGQVFKYGAPAVGNSQALAGEWLSIVGAPVKMVYGYGGSNEVMAAIDRKEIDLQSSDDFAETPEASMPRAQIAFPEWLTGSPKFLTPVLATRNRIPQAWMDPWGYKSPPLVTEAVESTQLQKDAYTLAFAVREAVDPLSLPPGVPDDVYQALKQAMMAVCADPGFVSAMKERGFDGGYRSPEELDTNLTKLRDAPKETVDIVRRMYAGS